MVKVQLKKKVKKVKAKTYKFTIECQNTVEDNVISLESFAKYFRENIKNEGKKNNLGEKIAVTTEGYNIVVTAKDKFSKRYLKYLSKRYLKKQELRDYIRVIANGKAAYQLKYFNVNQGAEAAS
uniref:Large ribosomal subunit protein eL22 n=1 Tax=Euplotes harpa TaxID=151035 RepID=A0A7S3J318_9SPIT|mmetsp:Transcript_14423/g.16665  ORF Transcript_14423/g.16665 Transcript_14423/m.16665 type:complete len:124 (+) Transcript_14423:16-387(+)